LKIINSTIQSAHYFCRLQIDETDDGRVLFVSKLIGPYVVGAFAPIETLEDAERFGRLGTMVIDADRIFTSIEPQDQDEVIKELQECADTNFLAFEIITRIFITLEDPTSFELLPLKFYCPHIPILLPIESKLARNEIQFSVS